jgi:hypothetical protein
MVSLKSFFISLILGGAVGLSIIILFSLPESVYETFGYREIPILGEISALNIGIVGTCSLLFAIVYVYFNIKFM